MLNNIGPSTEHWGTPEDTGRVSDVAPLTQTYCFLKSLFTSGLSDLHHSSRSVEPGTNSAGWMAVDAYFLELFTSRNSFP